MNTSRNKTLRTQLALFQTSGHLMSAIIALPKVELHRHLTGSITAETAIRVAARHDIELPSYITRELNRVLFPTETVDSHAEYFTPWEILNKLFSSLEATRDLVTNVISQAASDNVAYMELRLGPRGFLGDAEFTFEEFIRCVTEAGRAADERYNTNTRFILGLPRHVFAKVPDATRRKMLSKMLYTIRDFRSAFVGVDLNGDELAASSSLFESYFNFAHSEGLGITVHAGELSPDAHEIDYAVHSLFATRIGHGLAAVGDRGTLSLLHNRQTLLELCPTSNEMLKLIHTTADLPINALREHGIPFAICTDNPARCQTSMSEELFKVATAFSLGLGDIQAILMNSINFSFADEATKESIRARILAA